MKSYVIITMQIRKLMCNSTRQREPLPTFFMVSVMPLNGVELALKSQVPFVCHTSLLAFHLGASLCLSSYFVYQILFKHTELLH